MTTTPTASSQSFEIISRRRLSILLMVVVLVGAVPVLLVETSPVLLIAIITATTVSATFVDARNRPLLPVWAVQLGVLAVTGWACVEHWIFALPPESVLGRWIVWIIVCKCFTPKSNRDYGQIIVLALLLLVIHARLSATVLFPLSVLFYAVVGTYAISLFQLKREAERWMPGAVPGNASPSVRAPLPSTMRRALGTSTLILSAGAMAVGACLFVLVPRLGAGVLGRATGARSVTATGFGDTIEFGNLGARIQQSSQLVMRVVLRRDGEPFGGPDFQPYFRGQTLDAYERMRRSRSRWLWRHRPQYPRTFGDIDDGQPADLVEIPEDAGPVSWIEQDVTLVRSHRRQPVFSIFPPARFVSRDFRGIEREWSSKLVFGRPKDVGSACRYVVYSPAAITPALDRVLEGGRTANRPGQRSVFPAREPEVSEAVRRYVDQRGLLNGVDRSNPEAVAAAIEDHFRVGDFEYTLDLSDADRTSEPIEDFLFSRRRGHCEYFASAMAVLCQLQGLRARVVTGYHGGDYNEVGGFYEVRENHAHSWVEIHLPGFNWEIYDPTPPVAVSDESRAPWWAPVTTYFSFLEFKWASLVLAYDAESRNEFLQAIRRRLARVGSSIERLWNPDAGLSDGAETQSTESTGRTVALGMAAVILAMVLAVRMSSGLRARFGGPRPHRGRSMSRRHPHHPDAAFYDEFLGLLRRMGHVRPAHQTPREFAVDVAGRCGWSAPTVALADALYHVEYGRRPLLPEQQERIADVLASLRQIASGTSKPQAMGPPSNRDRSH